MLGYTVGIAGIIMMLWLLATVRKIPRIEKMNAEFMALSNTTLKSSVNYIYLVNSKGVNEIAALTVYKYSNYIYLRYDSVDIYLMATRSDTLFLYLEYFSPSEHKHRDSVMGHTIFIRYYPRPGVCQRPAF